MTLFLWIAQVAASLLLARLVWQGFRGLFADPPERPSSRELPSGSSGIVIRPRPRQ